VLLRWGLQRDLIVLPRSSKTERISENIHVFDFEISGKDMARLDALNENFRAHGNPNDPDLIRSLPNW
jgi:diketogulonate reductase-like aldo/keto reductase